MSTLFDRLQATIAATLKVPAAKITPTTINEDLAAWDSLGQVNLMMALEQTFDLYIEVEDFEGLHTVPAILAYLQRMAARPAYQRAMAKGDPGMRLLLGAQP